MSKKDFGKEQTHFSSSTPETPYLRAQREWDDRIGSARIQAKNWRLVSVLSLMISLCLLILLFATLKMRKNIVYVARVAQNGRIINVAPLVESYQPTRAETEYFIGQFIHLVRGLPMDPVVARKNWLKAYQYVSRGGSEQLNQLMKHSNVLKNLGKETVSIKINDVNPLSKNTYQVDWTETDVNLKQQSKTQYTFSGLFTTVTSPPKSQTQILQNPLGIKIVHFTISSRENS